MRGLARPLRIEYAQAVYHVMARGSHGQMIWADEGDCKMWAILRPLNYPAVSGGNKSAVLIPPSARRVGPARPRAARAASR